MSKQPGLNQVKTELKLFLDMQEKSHMKVYTCARIAQILYSDQRWDVMPSLGLCGISNYLHTLQLRMGSVRFVVSLASMIFNSSIVS
jgi:hypothetical protein